VVAPVSNIFRTSRVDRFMMPKVHVPPPLRSLTGNQRSLDVSGRTVREVIEQIDRDHAGFRDRVIADGRLKPGIAVAVGSRISDLGLLEPLQPEDEVHFVLSVSGG
jgi:sulfur-carrier protein